MKDSKWWNLMKILLWQVHFMDVEINALIIALLVYHFPYFKYHLTVFISHYIVSYVMIMFGFLQLGLTTYKHWVVYTLMSVRTNLWIHGFFQHHMRRNIFMNCCKMIASWKQGVCNKFHNYEIHYHKSVALIRRIKRLVSKRIEGLPCALATPLSLHVENRKFRVRKGEGACVLIDP